MSDSTTDGDLLNAAATGRYLGGVPVGTLRQWRYYGKGPRYTKLGRHVRYRRADLDEFISANSVDPSAA